MITERELLEAISQYEDTKNPTAQTCIALAAFYSVKEHLYPDPVLEDEEEQSWYSGDTEFGRYASKVPVDSLMEIFEELMETLKLLQPQLYAGVLQKLSDAW